MTCLHAARQQSTIVTPTLQAAVGVATKYLWISDAQLAESFARFVRVSRTHRRYQSSVPGPLEARRRLARRRIGHLGTASSDGLPNAEFGALFGIVASGAEPSANLTCPSYQLPPVPRTSDVPNQFTYQAWNETIDRGPTMTDLKEQKTAQHSSSGAEERYKACGRSRAYLETILAARGDIRYLSRAELQPLLDFLLSADDIAEAHNILSILRWLQPRKISAQALTALYETIIDKIRLGTIMPYCLRKVLAGLPNLVAWQEDPSARAELLSGYLRLQGAITAHASWMDARWQQIVTRSLLFAGVQASYHQDRCVLALEKLLLLVKSNTVSLDSALLRAVFTQVFATTPFSRLSPDQWSALQKLFVEILDTFPDQTLAHEALRWLAEQTSRRQTDTQMRATFLMQSLQAITRSDNAHRPAEKSEHSRTTFDFLSMPRLSKETRVVQKLLATGSQDKALRLYTVKVSIAEPEAFAKQWFAALTKEYGPARYSNPLGLALEALRTRRSIPPHIVSFLEHLATITASREPQWPSRQAFRWIWQCVQFLRQRGTRMNPRLARALLQAGVLRPLQDRDAVSHRRLAYVLQLVHKAEGSAIGTDLQDEVGRIHKQFAPSISRQTPSVNSTAHGHRHFTVSMKAKIRVCGLRRSRSTARHGKQE